ncbi:unnamed protein product [Adineta steineri]|uniref:Protein sleepless n=1 Tax=Adineta steineri TaxID=433720 RepID=A0A815LFJ3_9BILA|nr:unnamed protein product [Adineta steineri]CAF1409333.1 unnamed protein product [Adineta steineri]
MQYLMLIFVVLLALIPSITTLNCYVCNSNKDFGCLTDSNLAQFESQCSDTEDPYCRKIVQTVDSMTSVVRACGSKTGAKSCYKTAGNNHASVCSCNIDLCNTAANLNGQQRFMMIIQSIAALIITMMLLR